MIKVTIIYPADPLGIVPGGIDTFIRGILRWAPGDIDINLVGVTTDSVARPVGKWVECDLGKRKYRFYAAATYDNPAGRGRIPLSIRFMWGLILRRPKLDSDIIEFHRIEPSLLYYFSSTPKNAFFHQNMQVLHNSNSDILWSKLPGLYFWVQDKLMSKLNSVYAVRRDAIDWYKNRYPKEKAKFNFVPTWYDPDVFYPVNEMDKKEIRNRLNISNDLIMLVTVGRLDAQKNPLLLAAAFKDLLNKHQNAHLFYIGDGVLRDQVEAFIASSGLQNQVTLVGLKSPNEISSYLQAADLFVLSSAYEGMPMCVLEALGSGCPVVTTDVGEVGLVVKPGVNGEIITEDKPEILSQAIDNAIKNLGIYSGKACTDAAKMFTPEIVLESVYENYRSLSRQVR